MDLEIEAIRVARSGSRSRFGSDIVTASASAVGAPSRCIPNSGKAPHGCEGLGCGRQVSARAGCVRSLCPRSVLGDMGKQRMGGLDRLFIAETGGPTPLSCDYCCRVGLSVARCHQAQGLRGSAVARRWQWLQFGPAAMATAKRPAPSWSFPLRQRDRPPWAARCSPKSLLPGALYAQRAGQCCPV